VKAESILFSDKPLVIAGRKIIVRNKMKKREYSLKRNYRKEKEIN